MYDIDINMDGIFTKGNWKTVQLRHQETATMFVQVAMFATYLGKCNKKDIWANIGKIYVCQWKYKYLIYLVCTCSFWKMRIFFWLNIPSLFRFGWNLSSRWRKDHGFKQGYFSKVYFSIICKLPTMYLILQRLVYLHSFLVTWYLRGFCIGQDFN